MRWQHRSGAGLGSRYVGKDMVTVTKAPLVVWQDKHSVGDPLLDLQHRRVFDMINELYAATLGDVSPDQLERTLRNLRDFAATHFRDEEKAMREAGYPELAAHQRAHRAFATEARSLMRRQQRLGTDAAGAILAFLKHWWRRHVIDMDQGYVPFLGRGKRGSDRRPVGR